MIERASSTWARLPERYQSGFVLPWRQALTFARRKPAGAVSLLIILLFVAIALAAPVIAPYDPAENLPNARLQGPSWDHWMGTDAQSRDMFSRIVYGARLSLLVGISSVVLGTAAGALLGLVSGYFGGKLDLVLQRIVDIVLAVPMLILVIAMVTALGQGTLNVILALAIGQAPRTALVVRGVVLQLRSQLYVEAARAGGAGHARLMFRHILPNAMAPIIVLATAGVGGAIIAETSLSFLGLGAPITTPSWGEMLSNQARRFMTVAPWLGIFPGLAITLVVLAFNLFGDALRDVLDPRLRS